MKDSFIVDIEVIQPSQLYINEVKLQKVLTWINANDYNSYEAIPVMRLDEKIVFTDGHTRVYAAYIQSADKIKVYWDEDYVGKDNVWIRAYEICVRWCQEEDIHSIIDLKDRVISNSDYQRLWLDRCKKMHKDISSLL